MVADIRWHQRFNNFQKALFQLQKFIDKSSLSDLEELGLIKAFEYTYELAWLTLKDFLEYRGQMNIYGSRDAIQKAFRLGLFADGDKWREMLKSRHQSSQTYNEKMTKEISRAVAEIYFGLFISLQKKLELLLTE